jgi:hypothetical protein
VCTREGASARLIKGCQRRAAARLSVVPDDGAAPLGKDGVVPVAVELRDALAAADDPEPATLLQVQARSVLGESRALDHSDALGLRLDDQSLEEQAAQAAAARKDRHVRPVRDASSQPSLEWTCIPSRCPTAVNCNDGERIDESVRENARPEVPARNQERNSENQPRKAGIDDPRRTFVEMPVPEQDRNENGPEQIGGRPGRSLLRRSWVIAAELFSRSASAGVRTDSRMECTRAASLGHSGGSMSCRRPRSIVRGRPSFGWSNTSEKRAFQAISCAL